MERPESNLLPRGLWPRSLANQIALIAIILFSLGILFFSVHVAREHASFVVRQIQQSGLALAKNISTTGSAYLFSTYYEPLEELLVQAAHFPNVEQLEFLDTHGMVIREAKRQLDGGIKVSPNTNQYEVPKQITRNTIETTAEHVVIWQPIISGVLQGWVRVEMSLQKLHQRQQEIYRNLLTLGGVILLIILAVLLFYMRHPMQTLAALTDFASRLDRKHGESIAVNKTSKEITKLGEALNRVSSDLQQQKLDIQSALQALESQKAALDEHSIVSIADVRGNITYANDKFCDTSEYSREELIGQNHRIIKSERHSDAFYKALWKSIANGQVWKGEICNKSKSGREYWVETTIVPFLDQQQKPYQFVAIRTEITGLKTLANELADNRDRLEQSQAFANIGSWEWNLTTDKIVCSEQVPLMFGLAKDVLQTTYSEFIEMVSSADREKVTQSVDDCINNESDYNVEHRIVWSDGHVRWLHEKGNVVRDEAGQPVRMLGVVQDITDRKEIEKNLQALEEQIRQSQKMEAIGTMAGGIAHDFNNILTSIIGYTELNLMDMQEGSESWENQNQILVASNRARDVVNQILLFSRKEPEDEKVIRPAYVVTEAMRLLTTVIPKKVSLHIQEIDKQLAIRISPTQLHQVVINLCVNASHAIGDNEKGVITISLYKDHISEDLIAVGSVIPAGEYAVLNIEDTGCGIEAKDREHIFEPFYTTKDVDKGTGMGLAVVYGIVNKAGGAIILDSSPGNGTRFSLYFPAIGDINQLACEEA